MPDAPDRQPLSLIIDEAVDVGLTAAYRPGENADFEGFGASIVGDIVELGKPLSPENVAEIVDRVARGVESAERVRVGQGVVRALNSDALWGRE